MKKIKLKILIVPLLLLVACSESEKATIISIKNSLDLERSFETIELTSDFLKVNDLSTVGIRDVKTGQLQIIQLVDKNGDGVMDELLFQPTIAAISEKKFEIVQITKEEQPKSKEICYSRFVPERTDDYAWENDKVAFRVFGPTAQKMKEDGIKAGTLTSGVDAWLKKVDYPIINKWYKKNTDGTGSYHEDTGEGLDNFHVGVSRGIGGIAIRKDSSYYFSKNFTQWKTITTGPLRTSFYLEYENWDANGKLIKESKIISLDLGSNFTKFEMNLEGSDEISAGLTLHEKDGEVTGDKEKGWVSYWQPHGDSELGMAIIASPEIFIDFETYDTEKKDSSNAFAHLNVVQNKVVYYAGFGWKERGKFNNQQDWEEYLNSFSQKLSNPLTIELIN